MQVVLDTLRGFVIIIFILKDSCRAHECFQCRSDEDDRCADPTPPDIFRKACSRLSQGYCRKSTFTLYFTGQNRPIVLRECAENADFRRFDSRKLEGGCHLGKYTRDSHSVTCECRGDFCNGSNRAVLSPNANVIVFQILLGWIPANLFLALN